MLVPRIMKNDLWSDWMNDFWGNQNNQKVDVMKTDVKENDKGYSVEIDLPGYKKDDVQATLEDGYLTISASKNSSNEEKDEDGKYIRRERFYGNCSRSFYVGEAVTDADITAKFEDGILNLTIPKKEPEQIDTKSYIQIEG